MTPAPLVRDMPCGCSGIRRCSVRRIRARRVAVAPGAACACVLGDSLASAVSSRPWQQRAIRIRGIGRSQKQYFRRFRLRSQAAQHVDRGGHGKLRGAQVQRQTFRAAPIRCLPSSSAPDKSLDSRAEYFPQSPFHATRCRGAPATAAPRSRSTASRVIGASRCWRISDHRPCAGRSGARTKTPQKFGRARRRSVEVLRLSASLRSSAANRAKDETYRW